MQFFYDGQIRRYVTQLMRLMSNFPVKYGDGTIKTVPVMYGDLSRQVAHLIKDNSENKLPSAPRMSVYITGLEQDRDRTQDATFIDKLNLKIIEGTKSNFPADTAPEVTIISIFEFNVFFIFFSKTIWSLSLKIPPFIKLNKKFFSNDWI